jgi:integrase
MGVKRRGDRGNAWWYEFERDGVRHRHPCMTRDTPDGPLRPSRNITEAKAAEELAKGVARQKRALQASGIEPGRYMLGKAAAVYLGGKADAGESHRRNAQLYMDEIVGFFGDTASMADLTHDDGPAGQLEKYRTFCSQQTIKKWKGGRQTRGEVKDWRNPKNWKDTGRPRSKRTVNNYLKALLKLFQIADRTRDPETKRPMIDRIPAIKLHKLPRRLPRPIPDDEFMARMSTLPPWAREAGWLARLFGLRLAEGLELERRHLDRDRRGIRFDAGDTKSGNEEFAFGGEAGWRLLLWLDAQAASRGQKRLVTWPGPKHFQGWLDGERVPVAAWRPLKAITSSWRGSARRAEIGRPHRFHDVRARFVTEVAKVQHASAQGAARHQQASTTAMYIHVADSEIASAVDRARTPFAGGDYGGDSGPQKVRNQPVRKNLKLVKSTG